MSRPRKELEPSDITVLIDEREQLPWDLSPMKMIRKSGETGDYRILGLEHVVCVERKSLGDLLSTLGGGRDRFEREMQRILSYESRAVIVEASWADLERGEWRSQINPQAVIGSVLGFMARGVPFIMAGDRDRAQIYAKRFLFIAARRRWRESQSFLDNLRIAGDRDNSEPQLTTISAVNT